MILMMSYRYLLINTKHFTSCLLAKFSFIQSFCVKICCANLEKMFWLGKKTFSEKRKCDIRQEFDDAGKFQHFYRICIKVLSNLIRFPVNIQWSLYSWCLKKEIFSMIHWAYWNNKLKGLKVAKEDQRFIGSMVDRLNGNRLDGR